MKCVQCKFPMRPRHKPLTEFPGTRESRGRGLCSTCQRRFYQAQADAVTGETVSPSFDVGLARAALEAYMVERRKRREANGLAA